MQGLIHRCIAGGAWGAAAPQLNDDVVSSPSGPPTHFWHIWGQQNTSGRENSVTYLLNDVQSPKSDMFIWKSAFL